MTTDLFLVKRAQSKLRSLTKSQRTKRWIREVLCYDSFEWLNLLNFKWHVTELSVNLTVCIHLWTLNFSYLFCSFYVWTFTYIKEKHLSLIWWFFGDIPLENCLTCLADYYLSIYFLFIIIEDSLAQWLLELANSVFEYGKCLYGVLM